MDAASWGFVGTLVGAVVGALASIITTWLAGSSARKQQSLSDSLIRRERSREFQRTTLLELQESLALNARLIARAHLEDTDFYRKHPDSAKRPLLSDSLDQEIAQSNRRISLLTERLGAEQLRARIKELRRTMDKVFDARSVEESRHAMDSFAKPFEKTMEDIGAALRSYY